MQPKIDALAIVALAVIILLGVNLFKDANPVAGADVDAISPTPWLDIAPPTAVPTREAEAFVAPYASYILTQGLHGADYGHLAIDLGAGEGAPILSPIYGEVTGRYYDEWGNPALVIENKVYRVTMLHGEYTVTVGQEVDLGDPVGHESNRGWTTDMVGNPCWERPGCGYHTHLNVYDKRVGENVNPLELLESDGD